MKISAEEFKNSKILEIHKFQNFKFSVEFWNSGGGDGVPKFKNSDENLKIRNLKVYEFLNFSISAEFLNSGGEGGVPECKNSAEKFNLKI